MMPIVIWDVAPCRFAHVVTKISEKVPTNQQNYTIQETTIDYIVSHHFE